MVEAVCSRTSYLNGVITCAGVTSETAAQVNYFGTTAALNGLRPLLIEGSHPRAVAISSVAAVDLVKEGSVASTAMIDACLMGDEERAIEAGGGADYPGSKCAVCMWIRREAITPDWVGSGILLNCVAPGVIRTPMTLPLLTTEGGREILAQFVPMPMGGPSEPVAVARLLSWLISPDNEILSGQVIFADGGSECVTRGPLHF